MKNICPKCGAPVVGNGKFCEACGEPIREHEIVNKRNIIIFLFVGMFLVAAISFGIYYHTVSSPEYAMKEIHSAIQEGNEEKFKEYVDIDRLFDTTYESISGRIAARIYPPAHQKYPRDPLVGGSEREFHDALRSKKVNILNYGKEALSKAWMAKEGTMDSLDPKRDVVFYSLSAFNPNYSTPDETGIVLDRISEDYADVVRLEVGESVDKGGGQYIVPLKFFIKDYDRGHQVPQLEFVEGVEIRIVFEKRGMKSKLVEIENAGEVFDEGLDRYIADTKLHGMKDWL